MKKWRLLLWPALALVVLGGGLGYRHYWYADNLEDPNDRGYDAMRRLFLIEMAKMAGEFGGACQLQQESALREPVDLQEVAAI